MCGVCGVWWTRSEAGSELAGRWRSKNDPRAGVWYPVAHHTSAGWRHTRGVHEVWKSEKWEHFIIFQHPQWPGRDPVRGLGGAF